MPPTDDPVFLPARLLPKGIHISKADSIDDYLKDRPLSKFISSYHTHHHSGTRHKQSLIYTPYSYVFDMPEDVEISKMLASTTLAAPTTKSATCSKFEEVDFAPYLLPPSTLRCSPSSLSRNPKRKLSNKSIHSNDRVLSVEATPSSRASSVKDLSNVWQTTSANRSKAQNQGISIFPMQYKHFGRFARMGPPSPAEQKWNLSKLPVNSTPPAAEPPNNPHSESLGDEPTKITIPALLDLVTSPSASAPDLEELVIPELWLKEWPVPPRTSLILPPYHGLYHKLGNRKTMSSEWRPSETSTSKFRKADWDLEVKKLIIAEIEQLTPGLTDKTEATNVNTLPLESGSNEDLAAKLKKITLNARDSRVISGRVGSVEGHTASQETFVDPVDCLTTVGAGREDSGPMPISRASVTFIVPPSLRKWKPSRKAVYTRVQEAEFENLIRPFSQLTVSYAPPSILICLGLQPRQVRFLLHSDVLCTHSTFFAAALSGHFYESFSKTIYLPEANHFDFETFICYMYTGRLTWSSQKTFGCWVDLRSRFSLRLIEAYVLGDTLGAFAFMNCIMNTYVSVNDYFPIVGPSISDVHQIYDSLPLGCGMRRYLVECYAHICRKDLGPEIAALLGPKMESLAEEGGEFMMEVVRCLIRRPWVDPYDRAEEFWHDKERKRGEGKLEDLIDKE